MMECYDVGLCMFEMIVYNKVVYFFGQILEDISQDIIGQIWQVLVEIDKLLVLVVSDCQYVLCVEVFLVDIVDFDGMNKVWDEWVVEGVILVCVIFEVKFVYVEWKVEIVVMVVVL